MSGQQQFNNSGQTIAHRLQKQDQQELEAQEYHPQQQDPQQQDPQQQDPQQQDPQQQDPQQQDRQQQDRQQQDPQQQDPQQQDPQQNNRGQRIAHELLQRSNQSLLEHKGGQRIDHGLQKRQKDQRRRIKRLINFEISTRLQELKDKNEGQHSNNQPKKRIQNKSGIIKQKEPNHNEKESKIDKQQIKFEKFTQLQSQQTFHESEDQQDARKIKKGSQGHYQHSPKKLSKNQQEYVN